MIQTRHVMRSLPLLASALGDQYGVKVEIGGRQAFTDGKTVHLPSLPLDCDATLLGLARGMLDHEAAHIRETDFELLRSWPLSKVSKHVWNILEDWRVEHQLTKIFPGCRRNFDWLIKQFFTEQKEQARAGDTNPALAIMNAILLTVRAWDVAAVIPARDQEIREAEVLYPGLWLKIMAVLERTKMSCRSTRDALDSADAITALLRAELRQAEISGDHAERPSFGGGDIQGDSVSRTQAIRKQADSQPQSGRMPGNEANAASETGQCLSCPESEASDPSPDDQSGQWKGGKQRVENRTQARQALRKLLDGSTPLPLDMGEQLKDALAAHAPTGADALSVAVTGSKSCLPLSQADMDRSKLASVALRTRLQRLLQATQLMRFRAGRRGKLAPARLHRLAVSDPHVFLAPEVRPAVNTAVHILLDTSGSMHNGKLELAALACHAVVCALYPIKGVQAAVSAFPAEPRQGSVTVAPLIRFGERPHGRLSMRAVGGTPLGEAIWWAVQRLLLRMEERKCLLILTDGEPDSVPAARQAINTARSLGMEIHGIGIQSRAIAELLPDSSLTISHLNELAPAMFRLLQGALLRGLPGGSV